MRQYFLFLTLGLLLIPIFAQASIEHLEVHSASMDRQLPVAVVLPACYHEVETPYPVIYLLHGAMGSYRNWLNLPEEDGLVQQLADHYRVIFVLPSGDRYSYYFDSPGNQKSQFETHITREVIPFIDSVFRTIDEKPGRAITGLSMGGHGALYLAARNPELFAAAGSMSGVADMDVASWELPEENKRGFVRQIGQTLGSDEITTDFLAKHSVTNLVTQMKENQMPLIIDCGVDDFLLEANRELNNRLLDAGVAHDYIERPGAHDWAYWTNALLYQVLFITEVFKR